MQLTINGAPYDVPDALAEPITIRAVVEHLALGRGPVAVEVNRTIVPRAEHASYVVKAGDALEIVHLVGGG